MNKNSEYKRNCEIRPGREFPEGMQRIALGVEYNGAAFHGFQTQKNDVATVQENLQQALSSVADEDITLVCAGRTDTGVHASEQVIHFDTLSVRPLKAWSLGVNARLPAGICVRWAKDVGPGFHARFSALSRRYRYVILNRSVRPALLSDQITWFKRPLNLEAMQQAAQSLVGTHDFSALRAAQCQAKTPIRTMHHIAFARWRDMVVVELRANAFLHHMVRNILGSLFAIGTGDKPVAWLAEVLASRDRTQAAATASSRGLYLAKIEYPDQFDLPEHAMGPILLPEDLDWHFC